MPTYDYKCEKCGNEFERMLPISQRKEPTEIPCPIRILDNNNDPQCFDCNGEIKQIIVKASGFAYDNIRTKHSKKEPGWFSDKIKDMKRNIPGNTL